MQTNGSTRLEILSNGNAQFAKSVYINSDKTLNFGNNTPSSGKMRFLSSNSSYNNFIDFKGNLYFRNIDNSTGSGNEGACLSLQSDGSISIGTWEKYDNSTIDLQGNKLSVNGGILCERLKVISSVPESDYVFEKEYNLLSLSEVESFIKKYKHLPEVPSAKEFKENGYDLGEMDDLLLRKVEELTLYVIELQKEIETLKKSK